MTIGSADHAARIAAGVGFEWDLLPRPVCSVGEIGADAIEVCFRRERHSQRGLHRHAAIRTLWASGVDDAFLDEIVRMPALETLSLGTVTAADLRPLAALPRLRRLVVKDAPRIEDLEWTRGLQVESLGLENFKRVTLLDPLAQLTGLRGLAVEGSMWTAMRVASLQPLAGLQALEGLFLTNLRVADRSLRPLHALPELRELQCARWYAEGEFAALAAARPDLRCCWFDPDTLTRRSRRHGD
jgi:hypothetical protein